MQQYTAQNILSTPAFIVSATFESIKVLSKHYNQDPEDVMIAFINRAPNVVKRVQEVIEGSAQALADKLNKEQGVAHA